MADERDIACFLNAFGNASINPRSIDSFPSGILRGYLSSLCVQRSDPEAALSEAFRGIFQADLPQPQTAAGQGSIDYSIETRDHGRIGIELKKFFEYDGEKDVLVASRTNPYLNTSGSLQLKDQIFRYASSGNFTYIILTNLKSWFCYNPSYCTTLRRTKPFCEIGLDEAFRRFSGGFSVDGMRRLQRDSSRIDLGDRFYADLRAWVDKLRHIPFVPGVNSITKLEDIVFILNKFIFVRTLEANMVVQDDMIGREWDRIYSDYPNRPKLFVQSFFKAIDDFFHFYYDTELFDPSRTRLLFSHTVDSEESWKEFIRELSNVLGMGVVKRGIRNYRFEQLDIDIFGGTYERFLAEEKKVRKARGIYYTPQYVTDYIVYQTTIPYFDERIRAVIDSIESGEPDLQRAQKAVSEILEFKICDISCGSGSFLTQAFGYVWEKYHELGDSLRKKRTSLQAQKPGQRALLEGEDPTERFINQIIRQLGLDDNRRLASLILLRHIFGVDFDRRATEVAKLNLWLEAIRLAPEEFRHDTLPSNASAILPDLELNLVVGDSIIGLSVNDSIQEITTRFVSDLLELSKIRNSYLEEPTKQELAKAALEILTPILAKLSDKFKHKIESPACLPLVFWPAFFDADGKPKEKSGFDAIVGNPPYGKEQTDTASRTMKYRSTIDTYTIFMERGLELLRSGGRLGFIVPVSWQTQPEFVDFRTYLITEKFVENVVNLPFDTFKDAYVDCGIVTVANQGADQ